jgi:hypothetical protein
MICVSAELPRGKGGFLAISQNHQDKTTRLIAETESHQAKEMSFDQVNYGRGKRRLEARKGDICIIHLPWQRHLEEGTAHKESSEHCTASNYRACGKGSAMERSRLHAILEKSREPWGKSMGSGEEEVPVEASAESTGVL